MVRCIEKLGRFEQIELTVLGDSFEGTKRSVVAATLENAATYTFAGTSVRARDIEGWNPRRFGPEISKVGILSPDDNDRELTGVPAPICLLSLS
jgi:hypothetical protein